MWSLGDTEFEYFRNVVYRESGIKLTELKKALVQARLTKRIRQLKMSGFEDYCEYVKQHYHDELENLINCITTNKTDFFRENKHFEFMKEKLIPMWSEGKKRRIRIWSAGCSTGEEPYSIAIIMREHYPAIDAVDVKILATDIDTDVLTRAEKGIYSVDAVSDVPMELAKKYFLKGKGENDGFFKVKDEVRKLVRFGKLNLLDERFPMKGKFDLIFCRNVIIYFDKETQRKLFEKMSDYLEDDGFLFVGHSETLTGLYSGFKLVANSIYRKVL